MRRIPLYSLLFACVLGRNISTNISEVEYEYDYDYEETDNCSLAAPLYFPLRRSESFYRRIRDDIIQSANSEAEDIAERIQLWTERGREFRFWSDFKYPMNDELAYKDMIARGSLSYLSETDIFHSYISWGDWGPDELRPPYMSRAEKDLDEFFSNLSANSKRYQNIMKNWVKLIKPDTWPYLASCLYEAFKETQDSSSLSQAVTDLVSDEDFEEFNGYFKKHVGYIAMALKNVLESGDTIEMVALIYELAKSEIKSIDYNDLQSALYYFVLQLKTVLMKPDFKELWSTLNETEYFIQESVWKFTVGRWPEMERFVENFLRRTAGSIVFWDRLTGPFLTEMENLEMEKIPELKKKMITVVEEFFENLDQNNIMSMIADGDEVAIRQLFRGIRRSKWETTVSYYIWMIGEYLTSCNLATLMSYLPSYNEIKSTIINNHFVQPIKTLLFKDWPQDEIYPASIEDFVRSIYDSRLSIFSAVFGPPCEDDNDDNDAPRMLTSS